MNEKEIVYGVILDIWTLLKKYGFRALGDNEWERLVQDVTLFEKKYSNHKRRISRLFRGLFGVIQQYYIDLASETKAVDGQMEMFREG